jgi:isopentenyl-diphosphate Delta-isomerase
MSTSPLPGAQTGSPWSPGGFPTGSGPPPGTHTALNLAAFQGRQDGILASGGLRTRMEAAKAVALGARRVGFALPVVRAAADGGAQSAVAWFRGVERSFRAAMIMTGLVYPP